MDGADRLFKSLPGEKLRRARIGYASYSRDLSNPSDRRRFPYYAKLRELSWELAELGSRYDVVVLSSKADIQAWERQARRGQKIVYELIDTQLSQGKLHPRWLVLGAAKYATREISRPTLNYRSAIESVCRVASAVICSTPEQQAYLQRYCPNVHVILDFHEELGDETKVDYAIGGKVNLVWEGLPYTLENLSVIAPVIAELGQSVEIVLHVITDQKTPMFGGRWLPRDTNSLLDRMVPGAVLHKWSRADLPELLRSADIGVIPIDLNNGMARGKPENKLLIMWRMGLPVVTSATPAYKRCMVASGIDLSCDRQSEWIWKLSELIASEDLRVRAGKAGRSYVDECHSNASLLAKWDGLLESVL